MHRPQCLHLHPFAHSSRMCQSVIRVILNPKITANPFLPMLWAVQTHRGTDIPTGCESILCAEPPSVRQPPSNRTQIRAHAQNVLAFFNICIMLSSAHHLRIAHRWFHHAFAARIKYLVVMLCVSVQTNAGNNVGSPRRCRTARDVCKACPK